MVSVLVVLASGGKLSAGMSIDARAWLDNPDNREQRGETVSFATIHALRERGLIRLVRERFPTRQYDLTTDGATVARQYIQRERAGK